MNLKVIFSPYCIHVHDYYICQYMKVKSELRLIFLIFQFVIIFSLQIVLEEFFCAEEMHPTIWSSMSTLTK